MKNLPNTAQSGINVPAERTPTPLATTAIIPSRDLLGQSNVIMIEHEGMLYTLRATRNGKLILTK